MLIIMNCYHYYNINLFITLKGKLKCDKPKIIKFVNYNKHTYIEIWFNEQLFLYPPIFGN
jgi:hypothetical protein